MADLIYKLQYNGRTLKIPGLEGYLQYSVQEGPEYVTLWETDNPFRNMYSITLNDSIYNYDEYIVYGSANRDNELWLNTENKYVVTPNAVNQGGCFYAGKWNNTSTYMLINGTEMWLKDTSGYITSSYFFGQANNATTWSVNTYTAARQVDLHPYKIVGVRERR